MPVDFIKSDLAEKSEFDLEDEEFIKELAGRYGVSNQAMTFRLAYLGYVQL
jgi:Zn-dependent peptidase ImmA (M78 family)